MLFFCFLLGVFVVFLFLVCFCFVYLWRVFLGGVGSKTYPNFRSLVEASIDYKLYCPLYATSGAVQLLLEFCCSCPSSVPQVLQVSAVLDDIGRSYQSEPVLHMLVHVSPVLRWNMRLCS